MLGRPLLLVAVLALGYGAWLLLNLIWLNVISGRRRLRPAQALSLAVWCRWGWLPLMVFSLLLGSIDAGLATVLAPTILGVGLLIEVVAGYKMMWDLQAVTYAPPARAVLVGFGIPFLLAVGRAGGAVRHVDATRSASCGTSRRAARPASAPRRA